VRPDHIRKVDRQIRDQWVLVTAKSTLVRLNQINLAILGSCTDTRILTAIRHYSITRDGMSKLALMVESAVQTVRSVSGEMPALPDIRTTVMEFMTAENRPEGVSVEDIIRQAAESGISQEAVLAAIESLIIDDECYQPRKGFVKLL
jgi:hypothetical protein